MFWVWLVMDWLMVTGACWSSGKRSTATCRWTTSTAAPSSAECRATWRSTSTNWVSSTGAGQLHHSYCWWSTRSRIIWASSRSSWSQWRSISPWTVCWHAGTSSAGIGCVIVGLVVTSIGGGSIWKVGGPVTLTEPPRQRRRCRWGMGREYPPPQPTRGPAELHKLPQQGPGRC